MSHSVKKHVPEIRSVESFELFLNDIKDLGNYLSYLNIIIRSKDIGERNKIELI